MKSIQTYMKSIQTYTKSTLKYMKSIQPYMKSIQTYMKSIQQSCNKYVYNLYTKSIQLLYIQQVCDKMFSKNMTSIEQVYKKYVKSLQWFSYPYVFFGVPSNGSSWYRLSGSLGRCTYGSAVCCHHRLLLQWLQLQPAAAAMLH